jgi:acyl carrier protein
MIQSEPLTQDALLRERVREIMATTFMMEPDELGDDVSQTTCGRWTSLYHMMLLVVLEEQFGVTFTMEEMTSMTSLAAIVTTLQTHGVPSA